jgi:very-short-patch-repair endonuclease
VRGFYATRPPRDDRDLHALRVRAAVRRCSGRALASHHSALVLHGLPTHDADLEVVHLTHRTRARDKVAGVVKVCRSVPGLPVGDVVPVALAVVQAGLVGTPLTSLVAADAALHGGLVVAADLDAAVDVNAGRPGIGPVRAVLRHADARIESVGESLLAHAFRLLGIRVTPQVSVRTDSGTFRADFRVEGSRVLVEFDGGLTYVQPRALYDEKRREDALRRAGWVVVRFVWSDLFDHAGIARRIAVAARQAMPRGMTR